MSRQGFAAAMLIALAVWSGGVRADDRDPFEGFNRGVYKFNDTADRYLLKPVAQGYVAAVPLPARTAFSNFLGNFEDIPIALNNLLQGKLGAAASDIGRVLFNSTLGVLGFVDVASDIGLEKHNEDFGQTLGYWGMKPGPYLVLPLLGPSTLRDTSALPVDYLSSVRKYAFESIPVRNSVTGLDLVNTRANLLGADQTLEEAALDKYSFLRNFYLQRRQSLIYDGVAPREDLDEEGGDSSTGTSVDETSSKEASEQEAVPVVPVEQKKEGLQ